MRVLGLVLAFCLCATTQIVDIDPWTWIKGRYQDMDRTSLTYFQMRERSRFGVVASHSFEVFQTQNGDTWLGFSENNNEETHDWESRLMSWDGDNQEFNDNDSPQPRPPADGWNRKDSSPKEDRRIIKYFTTKDGTTWAVNQFIHQDNATTRNPDPIFFTGWSYLYKFDGTNFGATPAFQWYSISASPNSYYFATTNREFLWVASLGATDSAGNLLSPSALGTPNCTYLEYKGNTWGYADLKHNCTQIPLHPLVFTNQKSQWLYLEGRQATITYPARAVNRMGVGQTFYSFGSDRGITDGLYVSHIHDDRGMDLAFSNVQEIKHFVNSGWDYIVALTTTGFETYRLHWVTDRTEKLFTVTTSRAPSHIELFDWADTTCASVSLGVGKFPYQGLNEARPDVQDDYFVIYCWEPAHDRWTVVLQVPSFGVVKTQAFNDGNSQYLVAMENRGHKPMFTMRVYEITEWYTGDFLITREPAVSAYEQSQSIRQIEDQVDDLHHYKAMLIAILIFVILIFLLQIVGILKGSGGGGSSGGGGDYQSFS